MLYAFAAMMMLMLFADDAMPDACCCFMSPLPMPDAAFLITAAYLPSRCRCCRDDASGSAPLMLRASAAHAARMRVTRAYASDDACLPFRRAAP